MLGIVFSAFEMIAVYILYNCIFENKITNKIVPMSIVAIFNTLLYYELSSLNKLTVMMITITISILALYFIYKKSIPTLILEYFISYIVYAITELVIITVLGYFTDNEFTILTFTMICVFIFLKVINIIINKVNFNLENIIEEYQVAGTTIVNVLILIITIIILEKVNGDTSLVFIDLLIEIVICIVLNIYYFKSFAKIIKEKNNLKVREGLSPVINELVDKFRANEHEFKNHLAVLYSMAELDDNDIKNRKIINYIDNINEKSLENKLLYIDNDIIKAVLYNKYLECGQKEIEFSYEINTSLKDFKLQDTDTVILFSNLLNNAIEAVEELKKKQINIVIDKEGDHYDIQIKNNIDKVKDLNIQNLFKKGYSTKGDNRGYGMYNLKKIVDQYKGKIQLSLEESYLIIRIII